MSFLCKVSSTLLCYENMSNDLSEGETQFHNFYGDYGARLSRTQSVHDPLGRRSRSYLIKILSPILFSAPDVHLKAMDDLWVDRFALKSILSNFFDTLVEEWKSHAVYVRMSCLLQIR